MPTETEFFNDIEHGIARTLSEEIDFGNDWEGPTGPVRFSYITDTQEFYAIDLRTQEITLVATHINLRTLEEVLGGWRDCYDPLWVVGRLAERGLTALV